VQSYCFAVWIIIKSPLNIFYLLYRQDWSIASRPFLKFIRNSIQDWSGVFSISSLMRTTMTSSPAFYTFVCAKFAKRHRKTWKASEAEKKSFIRRKKLKSFIEEQENVSTKKKTSYFLQTIQVETKGKNFQKIPAARLQQFAINSVRRPCL